MLEHYQGKEGRGTLLNALRAQFLVDGNTEIANMLAAAALVRELAPGEALFSEGDRGGDLFFILEGRVSVRKGDRELATCGVGEHIGEIGLLEPFKGRSASVVAVDNVIVAQISQQKFADIAEKYSTVWRRMALALARRLVKSQDAV